MLTDDRLNPMRRNAPLLVEEYRKLRERMQLCEKMMIAANVTLKEARTALEVEQKKVKDLEVKLEGECRKYDDLNAAFITMRDSTSMR